MLRRRTNARAECARDGAVMSVHAQCPFIGPDSGKWADMKHLPECAHQILELLALFTLSVQGQILDFLEAWMSVWSAAGRVSGDE